jgi:hypothetical protein
MKLQHKLITLLVCVSFATAYSQTNNNNASNKEKIKNIKKPSINFALGGSLGYAFLRPDKIATNLKGHMIGAGLMGYAITKPGLTLGLKMQHIMNIDSGDPKRHASLTVGGLMTGWQIKLGERFDIVPYGTIYAVNRKIKEPKQDPPPPPEEDKKSFGQKFFHGITLGSEFGVLVNVLVTRHFTLGVNPYYFVAYKEKVDHAGINLVAQVGRLRSNPVKK